MRALVTGAGGFVGVHLVRHLEESGDEVIQLERTVDGIDITDAPEITDAVLSAKPSAVYHLAGAADVGGSWDTPEETFLANAVGTLNVLEASRAAGAERVLAVSSADVYGRVTEDELPLDESQPLRPVSPYAASKVAAVLVRVPGENRGLTMPPLLFRAQSLPVQPSVAPTASSAATSPSSSAGGLASRRRPTRGRSPSG